LAAVLVFYNIYGFDLAGRFKELFQIFLGYVFR